MSDEVSVIRNYWMMWKLKLRPFDFLFICFVIEM